MAGASRNQPSSGGASLLERRVRRHNLHSNTSMHQHNQRVPFLLPSTIGRRKRIANTTLFFARREFFFGSPKMPPTRRFFSDFGRESALRAGRGKVGGRRTDEKARRPGVSRRVPDSEERISIRLCVTGPQADGRRGHRNLRFSRRIGMGRVWRIAFWRRRVRQ